MPVLRQVRLRLLFLSLSVVVVYLIYAQYLHRQRPFTANFAISLFSRWTFVESVNATTTEEEDSFNSTSAAIINTTTSSPPLLQSAFSNCISGRTSSFFCSLKLLPNIQVTTALSSSPQTSPPCPAPPNKLLKVITKEEELENLTRPYSMPSPGGFWRPSSCKPPSNTAVIVPYRSRPSNLRLFVEAIHSFLQAQNISYGVFIVEQTDKKLFNRGRLLNVGFQLAKRFGSFDCFVFHDSDKVPENPANLYTCDKKHPRHLVFKLRAADTAKYKKGILYNNFFGGVNAFTAPLFQKINGFPNDYFGWGREDDELVTRVRIRGLSVRYNRVPTALYVNLNHEYDSIPNKLPWPYENKVRKRIDKDGLNSLNYTLLGVYSHPLFTFIRAAF